MKSSRSTLRLALASALLLGVAAPASAAPIQRQFEAVLALHSGLVPTVFFTGSGTATVDAIDDHVFGLSLPAGIFATQQTVSITGLEVQVDASNGAGQFSTGSGTWFGSMPILGSLRICLGGTCDSMPFADVSLPLNVVGAGGTTTASSGAFVVSGNPWQTTTTILSGTGFISYFQGYRLGPAGTTSSTALTGGFMLFVTPVNVSIPNLGSIDFVAELGITFVPEPFALVMLGSGALGLLLVARRR